MECDLRLALLEGSTDSCGVLDGTNRGAYIHFEAILSSCHEQHQRMDSRDKVAEVTPGVLCIIQDLPTWYWSVGLTIDMMPAASVVKSIGTGCRKARKFKTDLAEEGSGIYFLRCSYLSAFGTSNIGL